MCGNHGIYILVVHAREHTKTRRTGGPRGGGGTFVYPCTKRLRRVVMERMEMRGCEKTFGAMDGGSEWPIIDAAAEDEGHRYRRRTEQRKQQQKNMFNLSYQVNS